ncbi:hypothetical protein DN069_19665 [Streptacidiphilus pinicola]|uniref:DUF2231 domain-containing protein n=1 Tax=Streptacidiphilus pinicola TaxID=2219663 RepID=A0A2X0IFY3_9ACTN|nr:DUF2231 domain-containing protein [Streptacidiphilus pinicola]RAG83972.1 hypothetical protein DN069_19665 [Streptacidiphilus pinicola]
MDISGPADSRGGTAAARRILAEVVHRIDRLDRLERLDPLAERVRPVIRALPLGPAREGLRGEWFGYPSHPALVQLPIGFWTSAAVLDLVPGERRAATLMVALGFLGALPAELAGWVDWAELPTNEQRRAGLVHAVTGAAATTVYGLSWLARVRGRTGRGRALGFAGLTVATVGGMIGGHLAHGRADHTDHTDHTDPRDRTDRGA